MGTHITEKERTLMTKQLGVDLGYGFVKVSDGQVEHLFPSVVGVGGDLRFRADLSQEDNALRNMVVGYGGHKYFVGDLAMRQSGFASRSLSPNRVEDFNTKTLFLASLALYATWEEEVFDVVSGLPTSYFATYRKELAASMKGEHKITFGGNSSEVQRTMRVERLRLIPQPFGTLYDRVLDKAGDVRDEELAKARVGIIDVGFKTSDLVVADHLEFIDPLSLSTPTALSTAYNTVANQLMLEFNIDRPNYQLDAALREGEIRIAGKPRNIQDLKRKAFENLASKIVTEVRSVWDYRDLDTILITGGGGRALAEWLIPAFSNALLVEDPQFANVRGFRKLAKRIFLET
jgi:plasmid segregation protein ParM